MSLYGDLPDVKNKNRGEKAGEPKLEELGTGQKWAEKTSLVPARVKSCAAASARPKTKDRSHTFLAPVAVRRASQLAKQRQGTSHSANSKRPRSASLAPTADTRTISKEQKSAENAGGNVTLRPSLSPGDPSDVGVGHGVEHKVKAHVFEKSKIKTTTSRYTSLSAVFDEYDPDQPFDYEAFCEERESREREEEERKKRENQRKRAETLRYLQDKVKQYTDKQEILDKLRVSGDEAYLRRATLSKEKSAQLPEAPPADGHDEELTQSGQMSFAERMMAKMGWKKGEGLGREKQGMKTPLEAQKTARSGGIIVESEENETQEKKSKIETIPTRVVLLKNMVGPGEVDWDLEEEVANECKAKYGPILQVTIFEATESTLPDSEVVKIFVEFEDVQGAMKAHADLNGRFFGGRKVDAAFFNEMSFEQDDLL